MGETLSIRLDDVLADALGRESRETGLPKGEIVRRALAAQLDRRLCASTIAGHFGTVRGPADLSTNRDYRRAWRKPPRR
jgi:hypothetical protein